MFTKIIVSIFEKILYISIFTCVIHVNFAYGKTGVGYVDLIDYSITDHALVISGWVASEKLNVFVTNIIVKSDDIQIYRGRMLRSERPDVAKSTGRQDWLVSGFQIEIQMPKYIFDATKKISVSAALSNGHIIELSIPQKINFIIQPTAPYISFIYKYIVLLALIAPFIILLASKPIYQFLVNLKFIQNFFDEKILFGLTLLLSFAILIASGFTGSSIALLFDNSKIVESDAKPWLGQSKSIRSDEWEVITPMAISQKFHSPKFPVINENWGSDGHNMLVVGMTGIPTAHISTLAKPATWGFFFLDLRSALAWYWWFPFFGCLATLWLVLSQFFALNWKIAAGLATSFAFSAYSVGFSGWPAYVSFFPLLSLLCMRSILKNMQPIMVISSGVLLGLSISGFALTLYPAWQISLAYLLLPFFIAWCCNQRKQLHFELPQWISLISALLTITIILGYWWVDASIAVQAIQKTIYPGGRTSELGGDIDPWFFIKGLMSIQTMYRPTQLMDSSDAASFIFIPFALIVACAFALKNSKQSYLIGIVVLLYMLTVNAYMYLGINATIARWSLWGMVTSYRMDLALGLAQVIFIGWLFSTNISRNVSAVQLQWLGAITGILTIIFGLHLYGLLPSIIARDLLTSLQWFSLLAWGSLAYLIVIRHDFYAVSLLCIWMLITSLPFNPLGQAPNYITLDNSLEFAIKNAAIGSNKKEIAIIDERTWSIILPIVGQHVTNSVFYHPPLNFWKKIDPTSQYLEVYNRYQRLFFELQPISKSDYFEIKSPRLDEVVLTMDPSKFDFKNLGANILLSPINHKDELLKNSSIKYSSENKKWILMEIIYQ